MSETEADAARVAEIRCDLKAVWESRSFPPGSGGTLGRLLEGVAWLLADRERQAARIDALERAAKNVCIAAHAFGWDSPELVERVFRLGLVVDEETGERE